MAEAPLLILRNIVKHFGPNKALDGINFHLNAGEVLALCGENGAGKSTLVKTMSGAHAPDSGEIILNGVTYPALTPRLALEYGISTIYQENILFQHLKVYENLFVGRELRTKQGLVDRPLMKERAREIMRMLGADVPIDAIVSELGGAQQKIVETARAVNSDAKILIMDEPSASFGKHEVELLFKVVERLRDRGVGIIFISHHLEEVRRIANRVVVLRDGKTISDKPIAEVQEQALIKDMIGRTVEEVCHHICSATDEIALEVDNVVAPGVNNVSLTLRRGEILGLAGLVGAGRTELLGAIFGRKPIESGTLRVQGSKQRFKSPKDAIDAGICLITEDRKIDGLFLNQSCLANIHIPYETKRRGKLVNWPNARDMANDMVAKLRIKVGSVEQSVKNLSGGNQQKIILAKWMATQPQIYLFDEPTRGIDIGAKQEVYREIQTLIEAGCAVLIASSELSEVVGLCDRVAVMKNGQITTELAGADITEHNIISAAL
ncbi:sugar ABC transporter ATP-binding protein [Pacificibacter marinus]|uniref:sugar ABC transporter ATP-binding protein n=1 Tax=Pacificibacter marinus TaxID=658057 RepID=UPI001C066308|nr:sugar ABC transporter ATP-binding protein [Pacificibacter marinus]MBU2867252.1 sugar ABC transporter ATP-binding protein [Pacificibacter marinus]